MKNILTIVLGLLWLSMNSQHTAINTERMSGMLVKLSTNRIEAKYSVPSFGISSITEGYVVYHYLNIPGTGKMQKPGKPALPALSELIAVPYNAEAIIESFSDGYTDYFDYRIHPSLEPATDHVGDPEPEFMIDSILYSTDAFFPANIAEITDTLYVRGLMVLVVQVRPVQYNPARGITRVHHNVKLNIDFQGAGAGFEQFGTHNSAGYNKWLSGVLLNGSLLPEGLDVSFPQADADYLIVTIDAYKSAADSIARWKRQMGYRTEIISQPSWTVQQVISEVHGRYHSYIPRPEFLLILGDHNHVPGQLIPADNTNFPTDLYYVCMDGSTDYYPDMAKGRISVANASNAMSVVQKIINYERNPVADSAFYNNALNCAFFQDDDTSGYATRRFVHTSEDVRDYMISKGYNIDRVYYTYSYINPTNYNNTIYSNGEPLPPDLLRANGFLWNGNQNMIAQAINNGRFYVLHRDHGATYGWGDPAFTTTSLNLLSNGTKLPVVFSINCQTGNFITNECFAEKFLRLSNGGAVGVFAASYISYSGPNDALTVGAFDAIWNDPGLVPLFGTGGITNPTITAHPPILAMGNVLNHAMLRMVQTWNGSTSVNTRQYRMIHYFGDPAMRMFTQNPIAITASIPDTVVAGTTHLQIIGCNAQDAVATILYRDTLIAAGTIQSGSLVLSFNPLYDTTYNAVVTITKNNHRPYIKEVVVVGVAPAQHNNPCTAMPLQVKRYCNPVPSGFAGASVSSVPQPSCSSYSGKDVWFSFIVPSSGKAEVEIGEGIQYLGVAACITPCSSPVPIGCNSNANVHGRVIVPLTGLTPGDTILVRVWQNSLIAPADFTICIREPDTVPVAQLPYYSGFESGTDQYWELASSNAVGRIRIDTVCDARYGGASLLMDQNVNGTYAQNEVRLRVDLRNKENVKLKFWWREYGDENNSQDGIFFSDDSGENFVKVIELQGAFEGWTQYVVDVDRLAGLNGLKLTESFVIKFQQYDNWGTICSNPTGGDGFAFDDVFVYIDTTCNTYSTLPYSTGFEDGFDQYWSLKSAKQAGRLIATAAYGPPYAGNYSMVMDVSSSNSYNLNTADLRINIGSVNNLILSLRWRSFGNESHVENGLYLSDDGGTSFTQILRISDTNQYWSEKNFNISAIAQAYNLNPGINSVLRFVQYDNYPVASDGLGFDNVNLYYASEPLIDLNPIAISVSTDTGVVANRDFKIINPGTAALRIDSITVPEKFQTTFSWPVWIQPGDTLIQSLLFQPDSVVAYQGKMRVYHNAARGLDSMRIEGLGMYRELVSDISAMIFDTIPWYESDTIEFNLTNVGTGVIAMSSVTAPQGFAVLTPQSQNFAIGQTRSASIKFDPPSPGPYSGVITISTDANQILIPVSAFAADPLSVDQPEEERFIVMPNPCNDYFLVTPANQDVYAIRLSDMSGRQVIYVTASGKITVDMQSLSAGIYILEIIPQDNRNLIRNKVVKE